MANNYITSNNSIFRNDSLTVSIDSTVTSDRPMLLSNHEQNLPTDNEFTNPSESDIGDLPPNYFDISIVPNGAILYNNDVIPFTEASKAEIERDSTGVVSFDPLIDRNPDQLWLYFMTYLNEKPQLKVHIRGYCKKVFLPFNERAKINISLNLDTFFSHLLLFVKYDKKIIQYHG
jgi:hypothetical protein